MAAPAVAVIGALAATPQVRHLVTGTTTAAAGQPASDLPAAAQAYSDLARGATGRDIVRYKSHAGQSRRSAGTPPDSGQPSTSASSSPSPTPTPSDTPSDTPSPSPSPSHTTTTAHQCAATGGAGPLPENYAAIVDFMMAHGYTGLAAAGIAGNIYQESKGNPESIGSGGGGLIGWTPLPAGYVTGNTAADLQTQLGALLTYDQQWAQYIPMLNSSTSATGAAYVYMTYFERPGIPAASSREAAASAVAQACGL